MPHRDKKDAYAADITYGTNNEFGFDYLRDNMALSKDDRYPARPEFRHRRRSRLDPDRRGAHAADHLRPGRRIAGAVRARSTASSRSSTKQEKEDGEGDYWVDEKGKQVHLSEAGMEHAEAAAARSRHPAPKTTACTPRSNLAVVHHLNAALRAHALYQRDVDYIVRDGEVIIVDEFTGRTLPGRRWSDGLHQAVEAKEGVPIQRENQTLASITFQNYFRMYKKLAGMTGTADTEAYEFQNIYGLEVVVIPTHRPMIRKDDAGPGVPDPRRASSTRWSMRSSDCYETRPAGAGRHHLDRNLRAAVRRTASRPASPHEVLNAKQHEREAEIVAQAGPPECGHHRHQHGRPRHRHRARRLAGSRTAGAGRRTPTEARPRPRVKAELAEAPRRRCWPLGGLHIIGTERHESRRIDNQLRGRSGRQGDPGSSRFYLSLEDNLMRIFAADWVQNAMRRMGMKEDEVIEVGAGHQADRRTRSARSRRTTSTSARTCSNTTTSPTTSAR